MAKDSDNKDITLKRWISRYLSHIEIERNYSKYTLRNYGYYLDFFRRWFGKNYEQEYIQRLTEEMVRQYRLHLSRIEVEKGRYLSPTTQAYYVIALRAFLKFLVKRGIKTLVPEKIDLPKTEARKIKFLTREQVERLLNMPSLSEIEGLRDKALLEMLFSTGLRVSEIAKLDRDKIDFKRREFGIIGKGRRTRVVFLTQRANLWIQRYLSGRDDHYKPMWIRFSGKKADPSTASETMRLSVRGIQRIVEKYRRKAKLPIKVTPHILRHSYATTLLQGGADLRSVQEMLGHKNVVTTQIYTHVTNPQLKRVHEEFFK